MSIEQERAAFEAWYQHHHGDRDVYVLDESGEYADKQVQGAFNVWQARAALSQQPAAPSETVNVIGMPEFDGLLDHIYEYGTKAEGVIEKANTFAQAVIARYAPQQPAAVDEALDRLRRENVPCLWHADLAVRMNIPFERA